MPSGHESAIQAYRTLNVFVGDLFAGTRVREFYLKVPFHDEGINDVRQCVNRMCLSYLVLTLCKVLEFYEKFHHVIPDDCREEWRRLIREIRRRNIKNFRDKVVGHIWDNEADRPLSPDEVDATFARIVQTNAEDFSNWCNTPSANVWPNTIISIVRTTRDRIRDEYKLTDQELFAE